MSAGRLPAPERRQQLLDTARMVFARSGFHETSMNDVATEAGVTKPVLYQHFASKRDLFQAVLEDVGQRLENDIIKSAAQAGSPREQVAHGLGAYLRFVESDADGFRLLFTGTSREDDEWVMITQRVEGSIARSIAALIDVPGMAGDRRIAFAHGMVGLAEGMVRHWLANEGDGADRAVVDAAGLAADMTTLAWGGLRGLGSTS